MHARKITWNIIFVCEIDVQLSTRCGFTAHYVGVATTELACSTSVIAISMQDVAVVSLFYLYPPDTKNVQNNKRVPLPTGAFGSVELAIEYVEGENLLKVTIARCKVRIAKLS